MIRYTVLNRRYGNLKFNVVTSVAGLNHYWSPTFSLVLETLPSSNKNKKQSFQKNICRIATTWNFREISVSKGVAVWFQSRDNPELSRNSHINENFCMKLTHTRHDSFEGFEIWYYLHICTASGIKRNIFWWHYSFHRFHGSVSFIQPFQMRAALIAKSIFLISTLHIITIIIITNITIIIITNITIIIIVQAMCDCFVSNSTSVSACSNKSLESAVKQTYFLLPSNTTNAFAFSDQQISLQ